MTEPELGRELFKDTIEKYLGQSPLEEYQKQLEEEKIESTSYFLIWGWKNSINSGFQSWRYDYRFLGLDANIFDFCVVINTKTLLTGNTINNSMQLLSSDELIELGEKFNVTISESEVEALKKEVNSMLIELDYIDKLNIENSNSGQHDRRWARPKKDPCNAINVCCNVPPSKNSSDVLNNMEIGIKDNIAVAGIPMDCGSSVLDGFIPSTDAKIVKKLLSAGATITYKTNLDEFAGSSRSTTSFRGPILNPYDKERIAGGSSAGSAVVVAKNHADVAIGTDTGGSIRTPASFCGLIGFKPTYGLVPLDGVFELAYTQDHVGPLAHSLQEIAQILGVINEHYESKTIYDNEFEEAAKNPPELSSLTFGILEEGFGDEICPETIDQTQTAIDNIEDAGGNIKNISLDCFQHIAPIKPLLSYSERADHWRSKGIAYRRADTINPKHKIQFARQATAGSAELSRMYKSKLLVGAQILEAHHGRHYVMAQMAKKQFEREVDEKFDQIDVLLTPTMPDIAPKIEDAKDPGFEYGQNLRLADVVEIPAVTLPNGQVKNMPIGIQLMANKFADSHLVGVSAAVESIIP